MFVALRDLRFARGRFALVALVVALVTLLVGFLSGLTGGLAEQNVSAVLGLRADRVVFGGTSAAGMTFADSAVTREQADAWAGVDGVTSVEPVGISQTRAQAGHRQVAVALFGVRPTYDPGLPLGPGEVVLSESAAADLEVQPGDALAVGGAPFTVRATMPDEWYSHTLVVRLPLADWQEYAARTGQAGAYATVLAVSGVGDLSAAPPTGTAARGKLQALTALSAFRSEVGSLLMMVGLLFVVSALVVGAFFTVWTIQRTPDIAVLKALGASTRSLVLDALGQALVVLVLGIGAGTAVVAGLGWLAQGSLPFVLSPLTTVVPALAMTLTGLLGAVVAVRSVTSADPLTALGSNR